VIGIAGSDWIEEKMSCTKRDPESGSSESLEEEEVTSKRSGSKIVHEEDPEIGVELLQTEKV